MYIKCKNYGFEPGSTYKMFMQPFNIRIVFKRQLLIYFECWLTLFFYKTKLTHSIQLKKKKTHSIQYQKALRQYNVIKSLEAITPLSL